ncbi:hypothetical protein [Oenococcus sp.]|uniref:hypothetical protein n=1 Tax=Oenococcus sp. TaxID=1979414 RepID=UPI0039ED77CB
MNQTREAPYIIRNDRVRDITSILVYFLILVGICAILVFEKPNLFFLTIILFVSAFILGIIYIQFKRLLQNNIVFIVSEKGITDLTDRTHVINLAWTEVAQIQMDANNSSLEIGIIGSQSINDHRKLFDNAKANLMKNGNRIFYNILIDGFQYRRKNFFRIWKKITQYASAANPNVQIINYHDPLDKKEKK